MQSHLKANLDVRHSTDDVPLINCDENQEDQATIKLESKNSDICEGSEHSNVPHEEDVHDSQPQNESELNADNVIE